MSRCGVGGNDYGVESFLYLTPCNFLFGKMGLGVNIVGGIIPLGRWSEKYLECSDPKDFMAFRRRELRGLLIVMTCG
jgi:hypothetical protein